MLSAQEVTVQGRLDGVSARLAPGRITAICGPNGAGKSSLLAAMAGLLQPHGGRVMLDDAPLASLPAKARARRIGYLPQTGEVAWNLSVQGLAALGRLPHGDAASEPVARALEAVDMAHLAARPVFTLSGGERARALLARVLAGETQWILADEPLAALDIAHQLAMLRHLRSAAEQGAGVVLVLHDLSLAMNHADEVVVLDEGRMAAQGAPADVLDNALIDRIWKVRARWEGAPGAMALIPSL